MPLNSTGEDRIAALLPRPRLLRVETGLLPEYAIGRQGPDMVLDYHVYQGRWRWWRRVEERLRTDLLLAHRAKALAADYDIVWAGSEKVGVPLALLGPRRPVVTIAHYIESPWRLPVVQALGIARRWAAIGYVCDASRDVMIRRLGVPPDRLFQWVSAGLAAFTPGPEREGGPILSIGVAKRDYRVLIRALIDLPSIDVVILASSRHGVRLRGHADAAATSRIRFLEPMPQAALMRLYQQSCFVVIPLRATTHASAGASVALEAAACGKAVVATRTAGMTSFVEDGVSGILVPASDEVSLRAAIQRLYTDPALAQRMGRAGRLRFEEKFHPWRVRPGIEAMLQEVWRSAEPRIRTEAPGRVS